MSGYDYDFVDDPPDRLLCNICRLPCRDPQRSVCCGHVLCKSELKEGGCPVPECYSEKCSTFVDKALQREIKVLRIYCPNKKDGCGWIGEIARVDDHLRGCTISCSKCKQIIYFSTMKSHLDTECPCYCPYCDITAEREVISSEHKEKCHKFPLTCPNNCGLDNIPRDNMDEHKKECPLEEIQCEYHCGATIARNEVSQHNANNILQHVYSVKRNLAVSFQNAAELERKCVETEKTVVASITSLSNAVATVTFNLNLNSSLNVKCTGIHSNYAEIPVNQDRPNFHWASLCLVVNKWLLRLVTISIVLKLLFHAYEYYIAVVAKADIPVISGVDINTSLALHDLTDKIPLSRFRSPSLHWELQLKCWSKTDLVAPVIVEIPEFNEYRNNKLLWVSNPFYAFKGGYLMCLKVSDYTDDKETYISVHLHLMKGQYDDELSWPMRGEYTIALLNLSKEKYYLTIYFDTNVTMSVENYQRVIFGKINPTGIGFTQFISYAKFNRQLFLFHHNSLFFKITYKYIE